MGRRARQRRQSERLEDLIDRSGGDGACWLWLGRMHDGNPVITIHAITSKKSVRRWFAEKAMGVIPYNYVVWADCGESRCVNPEHIAVGPKGERRKSAERLASA